MSRSRICWILTVVLLVGFPIQGRCAQWRSGAEPDGFGGIVWGQQYSTVENLRPSTCPKGTYMGRRYEREGVPLSFLGENVKSIEYCFLDAKFLAVVIRLRDWNSFQPLGEKIKSSMISGQGSLLGSRTFIVGRMASMIIGGPTPEVCIYSTRIAEENADILHKGQEADVTELKVVPDGGATNPAPTPKATKKKEEWTDITNSYLYSKPVK